MFEKRKAIIKALSICISLVLASCSAAKRSSTNSGPTPATQQSTPQRESSTSQSKSDAPGAGEATGSYTANGETVALKYAYAGRGQRFGEDSIVVLVTDQPIPPEAVAEEIKSQTMLLDKKIRGLEYVFMKDSFWIRFHPSQYQESKSLKLKEYSVANDVVKVADEDTGDLTNGKYSRSVKFVAQISK
ncbi:MAG: hypothetical protein ACMG6H_01735 [Acidobacteriota bacterium]